MTRFFLLRLSLVGLALFFAGCSPWIQSEQATNTDSTPLNTGTSIGQSFTSQFAGLTGIELYLQPVDFAGGSIRFRLYENPGHEQEIANASLPVSDIHSPGWYRFHFDPLPDSNKQDYYFELVNESTGGIQVASGPANSYLDGSLYLNETPYNGQIVFSTVYEPAMKLAGLVNELLTWGLRLLAATWLFILPGWALMLLLFPGFRNRNWAEKTALSAGVSLAFYPILFLWTYLLGMNLGSLYAWFPPIAGTGVLIFLTLRRTRLRKQIPQPSNKTTNSNIYPDLALIAVVLLVIFTRLWGIRMLDVPMWGDSYQHTMIAQLMVDNGGLFKSWLPYADLTTFTYHFGFHSLVAVFHWVTGIPLPVATLWTGQIINILAVLSLIPLSLRLGMSRWVAMFAVLVAGLLVPMPNFYVNWGRYTQLTGQAILVIAIYVIWHYFEKPQNDWRVLACIWLLLGGIALTHYRILILSILFIVTYIILEFRNNGLRTLVWKTILVGIGAVIIFLPWLIRVFSGGIDELFVNQISTPAGEISAFARQYNSIGNVLAYMSPVIWVSLMISVAWGLWRRDKGVLMLSVWWMIIILATNPNWLKLPGSGVISNFTVLIAAYIPAGLFIGASLGWITIQASNFDTQKSPNLRLGQIGLLVFTLLIGLWGARQRLYDFNPMGSVLFTRSDQRAIDWIKENTPEKARFLVNAFFAYGNWVVVGSDGGWWLPLLATRSTTLPPINYGNENGPTEDYRKWVNQLQIEIDQKGIDHPHVISMLNERSVEYVYIGQRQGQVNNPGNFLDPDVMLASPNFTLLYHQDHIYIFKLVPNT